MTLFKILLILCVLFVLSIPFLPVRFPLCLRFYNRDDKDRPSNLVNIIAVVLLAVAVFTLLPYVANFINWILNLPIIAWIISKIPAYISYSANFIWAVAANILYSLAAIVLLALVSAGVKLQKPVRGLFLRVREKIKQKIAAIKQKRKKDDNTGTSEDIQPVSSLKNTLLPENLLPEPEPKEPGRLITVAERSEAASRRNKQNKAAAETGKKTEKTNNNTGKRFSVAGFFMEQEDEKWYSRQQSYHGSGHLKYFLILCGVIYLAAFALLMIPVLFPIGSAGWFYRFTNNLVKVVYLYPAASLIILTEIFWYLTGERRRNPAVPAEEPEERLAGRVVDLDLLEKDLLDQYGKFYKVKSFSSSDIEGLHMPIARVDLDSNILLHNIAAFVKQEGFEVNSEYLQGIEALMNGKNVLFHAPLYTSLGIYLYAYLSMLLMQGEHILVVCQNKPEVEDIIKTLETGLLRASGTHESIWSISGRTSFPNGLDKDILVLSVRELCEEKSFREIKPFVDSTSVVMLTDVNRVVSANNYLCQIISQRLSECRGQDIQYLFLSTLHTANLENTLVEYFLLKEMPESVRGDYTYGDIQVFVWGNSLNSIIELDNAAQTVPLEVGISTIAANHGIPGINVVSRQAVFSGQVNSQWLSRYDATEQPIGFLVASDDEYNLPGMIYSYARYIGKKASVLHVVSKPYLLREYFYAHASRYLYEQPLMGRTVAEYARKDKTQSILLMCDLMRGMPLRKFILQFSRIIGSAVDPGAGFGIDEIRKMVELLLKNVLGHAVSQSEKHFSLFLPDDVFYPEEYIRIMEDEDVLRPLLDETGLIEMYISGGRKPVFLPVFKNMVYQHYLEGQNLVYENHNYTIREIDPGSGKMYVDDTNAVHGISESYIQVRHYTIHDSTGFIDDCHSAAAGGDVTHPGITATRVEFAGDGSEVRSMTLVKSESGFEMTADTVAYYMLQNGMLRVNDGSLLVTKLLPSMQDRVRRQIHGGIYLNIELERAQNDCLTMTLAVLLQEVMKTMFPDKYHCLSVCAVLKEPERIFQTGDLQTEKISGMYPRLFGWNQAMDNAVELLIVEDCEGSTGTMGLLFEQQGLFLRNVFWMLSDYLDWQKNSDESRYLYFGMDSEPEIFDLNSAGDVLHVFAQQYIRQHDLMKKLEHNNTCGLCLNPLVKSYPWNGRVNICEECNEEYRPDAEESMLISEFICCWIYETFQIKNDPLGIDVLAAADFENGCISMLNMEGRKVCLAEGLPLTAVHEEVLKQTVRYWQMNELSVNGSPLLEGQVSYVLLQYLQHIEQHQRRRRRYRRLLSGQEENEQGFFRLEQELQTAGHSNSFAFLLNSQPKTIKRERVNQNLRNTRRRPEQSPQFYFYEHLNDTGKRAYNLLLDGLKNMEDSIEVSEFKLPYKELRSIITAIHDDHPEVFWWNTVYGYTSASEYVCVVNPRYTMTSEERRRRQEDLDAVTEKILAAIPEEGGDYETALKLYEIIISILDYDSIGLDWQEKNGGVKSEIPDDLRTVYGALVHKKAVCAGYAAAYQYLLQQSGMEALYVKGQIKKTNGRHGWNIVNMAGDYYHIDVTWADGSDTLMAKNSETSTYAYFGLTDTDIRKFRVTDEEQPLPRCTKDYCNFFVHEGMYFAEFNYREVKNVIKERIAEGESSRIDLRFSDIRLLRAASRYLLSNGGIFEILGELNMRNTRVSSVADDDFNILTIYFKR